MFGPRITTVFASRWKALAWSGGVLLTAYCSVPAQDADGSNGAAANPRGADSAIATIAGLLGAGSPAAADSHVSPWAINSPGAAASH